MLNHSRGLWGGRWRAAGVNLLVCMLMAARGVGGSKDGVDAGDDVSLRQGAGGRGAGSGGEAGRLPTWFDDETMRVVGPEDTMYMGYCAFIPQRPATNYSAADDENLSLSRRINAGYRLPNTYRPGEWAPLRRFFSPPKQVVDENGVRQSMRCEAQPASWFTVVSAVFGPVGRLPRMGDHMGEDPTENKGGLNKFVSPFAVTRALGWVVMGMLPQSWLQYPYMPWVPWKPWKISLSPLPSGNTDSLNKYLHHNDLRPEPSETHPWLKKKPKSIWVRAPSDRDRDIAADWPIYSTKIRKVSRAYKQKETLLVLKGRAVVTCVGIPETELKFDDLATIPRGAECDWDVKEPMMMHYMFH